MKKKARARSRKVNKSSAVRKVSKQVLKTRGEMTLSELIKLLNKKLVFEVRSDFVFSALSTRKAKDEGFRNYRRRGFRMVGLK